MGNCKIRSIYFNMTNYEQVMNLKKKGFTLLELLIALSIIGIVLSVLFTFYRSNSIAMTKIEKDIDLQRNGDMLLTLLEERLMSSDGFIETTEKNNMVVGLKFNYYKGNKKTSGEYEFEEREVHIELEKDTETNRYSLEFTDGDINIKNYLSNIIEFKVIPKEKDDKNRAKWIIISFKLVTEANRRENIKEYTRRIYFRNE